MSFITLRWFVLVVFNDRFCPCVHRLLQVRHLLRCVDVLVLLSRHHSLLHHVQEQFPLVLQLDIYIATARLILRLIV